MEKQIAFNYLKTTNIKNPYALTLTCKQRVDADALDEIKLEANVKHFLNRLNYRIYKNQFKRFNKRLGTITVKERSAHDRYHVHMIIEKPDSLSESEMLYAIFHCWNQTKFGYFNIDFKSMNDNGWLDYMLKYKTKTDDVLNSIDWTNTNPSS